MKKSLLVCLVTYLMASEGYADTTEMVFYPKADFSSAVAHFYHQGEQSEKYGFLFDKGFDQARILYAHPKGYRIETLKDGKVKLLFASTDRYSYMQQVERSDFIISSVGKITKLLVSGGDCVDREECVTEQNILTLMIPSGYNVVSYKGLDHNLKELKVKEWKISGETYTLFAPKVKGACIYMELEKIPNDGLRANRIKEKSGQKIQAAAISVPSFYVYQNRDLFETGDVLLSPLGKSQFKKLAEKMKGMEKISIRLFQDTLAPKRLAHRYPSAQLFSRGRADVIKKQIMQLGINASRIEINIIDDKLEKTRVEVSFVQ